MLQKDVKKIGCITHKNGKGYLHFRDKGNAIKFLENFGKKLTKRYTCRFFSDKQYSLAKEENNYEIPFTRKQYNEITIL